MAILFKLRNALRDAARGGGRFLREDGQWATPSGSLPSLTGNVGKVLTVSVGEASTEWATPAGGSSSATTVETDLGTPKVRGKFTITDAAITATSKVLCWQAPGPYTGKGTRADEAEMQPVQVTAVVPGTGSAVVHWETPPMLAMVPTFVGSTRQNPLSTVTSQLVQQLVAYPFKPTRIGKVSGNVKFSYTVFA